MTLVAGAMLAAACGGGGGGKTATSTSAPRRSPTTAGTSASGSPGATTKIATSTPVPTVSDADAAATKAASAATATVLSAQDITGGDPNATPYIVNTIPAVPPKGGTTPVVDPTEIAPANVSSGDLAFYIDLAASTPGIQSTRDVNPGDVFQVGVVLANVPPNQNNLGGLAGFNFVLNYDKTKISAPSFSGGPTTNRNPKLNLADLGGDAAGWQCLPGPEGDKDDPGGISGDGNPDTGQAFISCYTSGLAPSSGTLVLATVMFTAIASGSTELTLSDVAAADSESIEFADCPDGGTTSIVPCQSATLTVK
ncbi:MAG: hypothetical protein M3P30_12070 [Chloroflexota bacterium]|nr:hypothetical protein [Chloroflexota bacterium]